MPELRWFCRKNSPLTFDSKEDTYFQQLKQIFSFQWCSNENNRNDCFVITNLIGNAVFRRFLFKLPPVYPIVCLGIELLILIKALSYPECFPVKACFFNINKNGSISIFYIMCLWKIAHTFANTLTTFISVRHLRRKEDAWIIHIFLALLGRKRKPSNSGDIHGCFRTCAWNIVRHVVSS